MQVDRKEVESHLQSAVRVHLDLACVKLNKTVDKLNDTEAELTSTKAQLKDTKVKLYDTREKLETTTKRVEEFKTRTFIWRIDKFSEILGQGKTRKKYCIESEPFYTGRTERYGYKLKVKIYPNGDRLGKDIHLSVYIIVLKGEYDAILQWPISKKFKITLIDQQEDPAERLNVSMEVTAPDYMPECFTRPVTEENGALSFSWFISHKNLHSRRYLVDDTLFLQVEVGLWTN